MLIRTVFSGLVGCAVMAASLPGHAADRGPSTPEERKQALEYIHDYLTNPLGPNAVQEREWVIKWVIEIPDVHVSVCPSILDKMSRSDKKNGPELIAAMMMGQTEFVLKSADKQSDQFAEYEAGVDAALNVYAALVKSNAKDRELYLDDLMQRRDAGTLTQFVHDRAAAACKN